MIGAIGIAISGMTSATKKAEDAAVNIANLPTSYAEGDVVDLSEEAVKLMMAKTEFKANAAVIRTVSDMEDELLNTIL